MKPYYEDGSVTLYHGDALEVLSQLPDESVDCIVTSPPYYGLRDYGVDGQIGVESSPDEFVAALVSVFREARRVLAGDGTFWLNLGDSFVGNGSPSVPAKNLLGIPWRVAFALQADGWILRNDIIWAKPNGMPESVTDRLTMKHEHVFLFAKSRRYWFDLDTIRKPHKFPNKKRNLGAKARNAGKSTGHDAAYYFEQRDGHPLGKNPGDVWEVATQPFAEAHFAVMPSKLAERCIQAGCKPGGTVLDPFSGSGTTGHAANKHGRKYVGIDLSADYLDLSLKTRLAQPTIPEGELA